MRNGVVVGGAAAAVVLAALAGAGPRPRSPPPGALAGAELVHESPLLGPVQIAATVTGLVAVLVVTLVVVSRPATAARRGVWFTVPMLLLGVAWWLLPPVRIGWFAYAPLSEAVVD